ncbi:MAG: Polysulfide reductase NrfD, partial [Dehalococcoidia bacterium]|nr:Polysulfide reductase NrfD [Dehalococcoidia bacterium]
TAGEKKPDFDKLTLGLGRVAALVLFPYFCLKAIGVMHENAWGLLNTPLGHWFMLEMLGFILLPCLLYLWGARTANVNLVRFTAVLTVAGIIVNRLNISIVAFNWNAAERYVPMWTEWAVTISIITLGVLTFRWIVNRMPVLHDHPEYGPEN